MQETATRPSAPSRVPCGALFASLKAVLRTYALMRLGVPPEAVALAHVLRASPELAAALRDPHVLALLRDPRTRRELADLLVNAAHAPHGAAPHVH